MTGARGTIEARLENGVLTLSLAGAFDMSQALARTDAAEKLLAQGTTTIRYEAPALGTWDGSLVAALNSFEKIASARDLKPDRTALPVQLRSLLELADAGKPAALVEETPQDTFSQVGRRTTLAWNDMLDFLDFAGQTTLALVKLARGRSKMRKRDFLEVLQSVSVDALGIVMLISFLVGLIIAFLGAVVLRRFGAEFAIAYLVGYGILREMGAIMTGVIMSGRTGAAFAAQIGSMKVSEEIDALKTLGIPPMDFIVLPRMIALVLIMPVLTIFADLIGIFGGYLVAVSMMGVPSGQFLTGLDFVAGPNDFILGLVKAMVFGVLIATAGCLRGLQCRASADAVGVAATRAVVMGITLLILANAIIDWFAARFNL
jgi:phospholipid/cholesterol/gamma-HCH transport system permease protein